MYRAILNDENICIGICNDTPLFTGGILVNRDVTGMKYDNGEWLEVEKEYEPTETELIQAEILLNQADIIAKQNEQDEVLAEILLNQMGV